MYHRSLPYERNPLFTGRERLLTELDTFFASVLPLPLKVVTLAGMPGIGKTEIAIEYAYRTLDNYPVIIWLDAPSRHQLAENIVSSFGLKLPWKTTEERERIFEAFRQWLWGYQSNFLLVLDQIGDYSLLNDVLDEDMAGHVLLTHSSWVRTDDWKTMLVQPFDNEEGPLFLLRRAGLLTPNKRLKHASRTARQEAEALHEEFGGHPLALDQAGAYINETALPLIDYLPLYRKDMRAFLERRGTASPSHPFPAYSVIAAMRQGTAYDAQELLFLYVRNVLDCSTPHPQLPSTLRVSSHLRQIADTNPSQLFEMRATLIRNFLLVPLDGAHKKWDMHPLVRIVMIEVITWLQETEKQSLAEDERYEPMDVEGIFQTLVSAQQTKKRLNGMPQSDPKTLQLARSLATTVIRFQHGILPGPREQRWKAKSLLEKRYGEIAYGNDAPLYTASESDLRRYTAELFAIMQYR